MMLQSKDFTAADWYKHIDTLEEIAKKDPKFLPVLTNMKKEWANFVHRNDSNSINIQINTISETDKNIIIKRMLNEGNTDTDSDNIEEI